MNIPDPARPRPLGWSAAGVLVALLCQPLAAGARASAPASQPPGLQLSALGTGTAPPLRADPTIPEPQTKASPTLTQGQPLNDARANFAPGDPPGEWHSQARDYANTRYSPLDQITAANVAKLRVAWSFSDGTPNGHEAAPLVVGDTMYIVTPFPNLAYALDLTKAGAPIKWSYDPKPTPLAIGKACCDTVNRGSAYADGKLIYNLLDGHTVALDAKTGKEVWRTKMGDVTTGMTMTMAPFVVGDKVYVGNSGGELGVWGWLAALDVKTGKELW
ncbi:MAG: PQQ-binding-like beta-propeller repeat protein, partial [Caldimonas sp.]